MKKSRYNIEILGKDNVAIYNLLTRNIILIDNEDYKKFSSKIIDEFDMTTLSDLGILLNDNIDEVELMKYTINKGKYSLKVMSIFLSLTPNCNLNCIYCYQDKCRNSNNTKYNYISESEWNNTLMFIKKNLNSLRDLNFVLFGGEPLLNKSSLLKIISDVHALRSKDLNVHISLITNGVELTDKFSEKIYKYVNTIQITIDGDSNTHDKLRIFPDGTGSFNIIYDNLKNSIKFFKNRLALRININKDNVDDIPNFLEILKKDNLNKLISISLNPIFDNQSAIQNGCQKNIDKDLLLKINSLYEALAKNSFIFEKNFIEGPCMAKHINSFAIDENNNIYECPGVLYSKIGGFINKNGDIKFNDSEFYKQVNEEKPCINVCKYAPICYGGCSWQNKCNKELLDITIESQLKSYLISRYNFKVK